MFLFDLYRSVLVKRIKNVLWTTVSRAFPLPLVCTFGILLMEPAAAQSGSDPVIYLDQAWSQADREFYYTVSQGSAVMDYAVFMNLEVAGSQDLFRSDANSDRYGLITRGPNPRTDPDGLPVGLANGW
jgi:hypothetical protein